MTDANHIHTLDVSELEPCEPLEKTLEALETLPEGHCLRVLHRREPHPLLPMLEKRGFAWRLYARSNPAVELWIWHQGNQQAADLVPTRNPEH